MLLIATTIYTLSALAQHVQAQTTCSTWVYSPDPTIWNVICETVTTGNPLIGTTESFAPGGQTESEDSNFTYSQIYTRSRTGSGNHNSTQSTDSSTKSRRTPTVVPLAGPTTLQSVSFCCTQ
ncbi:uncharacterized protein B0I36DRAFT_134130 [Microdochium trichocladiopsis]|uniref:Uncharacterized protein n=2 Tax=Microdochium TaxID=67608 RepID=A0A9P8Y347_9PEZI|nr:uncharacterized protein B0I36DRAFT_134130 [Microdochium trichocladiopsis]KAH7029609.1 hypothetical protein B0I36DRAFT_134130 [Microdochium trichocladiopsis]KXJ84983.1 hypothetical protein Micbo1qcDRAFT_169783 [Microdochium bolleyi]